MATKTFIQLQTAGADMLGYESPSDLTPNELDELKAIINAAVFECFVMEDGAKPEWPAMPFSDILKAPVSTTLTLTNGSKTVTGYAFEAKYAGSFVKIGEKFYRYGPPTSVPAYALIQPWDGETGAYAATVYHNALTLPWSSIKVENHPSLIGIGMLAPLPGPDAELMLRTEPAFDFRPRDGREPFAIGRNLFRQSAYFDSGDPRYYHIDQASMSATFAIESRIHVYPVPDRSVTLDLRAEILPATLTADADVPPLPGQAVDSILLPIIREKVAMTFRRYAGRNTAMLVSQAEKARNQLRRLARVQRETGNVVRLNRNW